MHQNLKIRRAGNLLEIEGDIRFIQLLQKKLVYTHKKMLSPHEARMKSRGGRSQRFEAEEKSLSWESGGKLYCPAGLYSRIVTISNAIKINIEFLDLRKNKLPPADFERLTKIPDLSFRYKQDQVLAVIDACEGGQIACPTGYGKTFIMVLLGYIYPHSRILFVSPGLDLLTSTASRLSTHFPADVGRVGGGFSETNRRLTLCSADSLHKVRLDKYHLIVYDEVHTAATDKRAKALCGQSTDAKFIGLSASVNSRSDGADSVVESIFGPVVLQVSYEEAANAGIVSKINTLFIDVPPDDFMPPITSDVYRKKGEAYWRNNYRHEKIAAFVRQIKNYIDEPDPQILIMCETVEHIFKLKSYLPEFEVVYSNMDDMLRKKLVLSGIDPGDTMTKERRAWLLEEFQQGRLRRVIANHCWKQGIDPVHLNCFIRADGGTSQINNIQLPGRLSRITKNKSEGLLVDLWDSFDPWTLARSKKRKQSYEESGFNILPDVKV